MVDCAAVVPGAAVVAGAAVVGVVAVVTGEAVDAVVSSVAASSLHAAAINDSTMARMPSANLCIVSPRTSNLLQNKVWEGFDAP